MLETLTSEAVAPFSLALALLFGLMLLEVCAALLGASLTGTGSDSVDIDTGMGAELGDVDGLDALGDLSDFGILDPQTDFDTDPVLAVPKPLAWLG
ncbi:MAG: hypothetical protein AAGF50_15250, partial [Pseudomonadota bacterium]